MTTFDDVVEILLVEDNPPDAELTIRTLKKNNLSNNLFWVKDGAEAVDFLFCSGKYSHRKKNPYPKVILLDLRLPKMDGMEVLKKIKGDERTRAIPVVVLTSSKEEHDIAQSYNYGVNSFITKPVDFKVFAEVVGNLGMYWLVINRPPE